MHRRAITTALAVCRNNFRIPFRLVCVVALLGWLAMYPSQQLMADEPLSADDLFALHDAPEYWNDLDFADLAHAYQCERVLVRGYDSAHAIARRMVKVAKDDQQKSRGYIRLVEAELGFGEWNPEWEEWLAQAETLAGDEVSLARGELLMYRGFLRAKFLHKIDEGLDDLMAAIWIGEQLENDELLAMSYSCASTAMLFIELERRSWEFARRAIYFAEKSGRDELQYDILNRMAVMFMATGLQDQAAKYEARLLKLKKRLGTIQGATGFAGRKTTTEENLQQLRNHLKTIEASGQPADEAPRSDVHFQLAMGLCDLERYDEALVSLRIARDIYENRQDQDGIVSADASIAVCLIALDEVVAGEELLAKTQQKQLEMQYFEAAIQSSILAAELLKEKNETASAYDWLLQAQRIRNEHFPKERAREIGLATDLFIRRHERTRENNAQMRVQAQKIVRLRQTGFAIGAGAVSLLLFGWLWVNRRALSKLERRVQEQTSSLQEAKKNAEEANAAKTRFLAHLNHELRNPLHAVLANAELLQRDGVDAKASDECLQSIRSNSEQLCQIVGDILDLSRVESGETPIEESAFNVREVIKEVFRVLRPLSDANDLLFTSQIAEDTACELFGDAGKLRQILINLGANAVKYSSGGKVAFVIQSRTAHDEIALTVDVEDTGPGINESEQQRIFQPFYRSLSSDPGTQGTGLGLPLAHSFAQLLGGDLTLVRSDTSGSCFQLTLPFESNDIAKSQSALPVERLSLSRRILVVDDDPEIRRVIRLLGESLGYDVDTAIGLDQIVELLSAKSFDSVLLDLQMPGSDGFVVAETIRSLDLDHQPRIVAITGNAMQSIREKALDNGFDDFLAKPFNMDSLVAII